MNDDNQAFGEWKEIIVSFEGICTCDHNPEEHGWGSCDNDGCDCAAGWVE